MAVFRPDLLDPPIDSIPTDDAMRSNEWTTRGNKMKPEGSATQHIHGISTHDTSMSYTEMQLLNPQLLFKQWQMELVEKQE